MADSTTPIQQIIAGAGADVKVNENFDAASPAMLYGRRASTTSGLTWGYYGGRFASALIANGTVALTGSTTNYLISDRSTGAVSVSTSATNWDDSDAYLRLYSIVCGSSTVTSYEDHRQSVGASGGGGGGPSSYADIAIDSNGEVDLEPGGDCPRVQLDGNVSGVNLPPLPATGEVLAILVLFVQDGVGGRTVTGWPLAVTWESGSPPAIDAYPGAITTVPLLIFSDGMILGTA